MGFNSSFSFLGIGLPELVFIVMLALVVLGPERLPSVAKDLIRAFFKLRNLSKDLTGQLESELGVTELKELKGIKTGKLIEDWANDELDLDFDADDQDRKAAAQSKVQKPVSKPVAGRAGAPGQVEPAARTSAQAGPKTTPKPKPAKGAARAGTRPGSHDGAGVQRVESRDVIGSANSIGMHPGSAGPDTNGAAPHARPADSLAIGYAAEQATADSASPADAPDSRAEPMANGVVGPTTTARIPIASANGAVPGAKDGWQETLQRRRLLRIRHHGHPERPRSKPLPLRIRRSRQRKQSPAFRSRAR